MFMFVNLLINANVGKIHNSQLAKLKPVLSLNEVIPIYEHMKTICKHNATAGHLNHWAILLCFRIVSMYSKFQLQESISFNLQCTHG